MPSTIVNIGKDRIVTTVAENESDIIRILNCFLSNYDNKKKIIGVNTEQVLNPIAQNRTAWLQLCDGYNCLIVTLANYAAGKFPLSLFNFLNLPHFTFVGFGIKKTMKKLENKFGLTCKNAVEVGPGSWNLATMTDHNRYAISAIISSEKPSGAVFDDWDKPFLNQNQIKLAVSNAHFAFTIANIQLEVWRVTSF